MFNFFKTKKSVILNRLEKIEKDQKDIILYTNYLGDKIMQINIILDEMIIKSNSKNLKEKRFNNYFKNKHKRFITKNYK